MDGKENVRLMSPEMVIDDGEIKKLSTGISVPLTYQETELK